MNNKKEIIRFLVGAVCGIVVTAAFTSIKGGLGTESIDYSSAPIAEKASVIAGMLESNYIGDLSSLSDQMYAGMVSALGDPYTIYLTDEQMADFMNDAGGTMCGIGIVISIDSGECVINDILDDSPAEGSGLMIGDVILAVDGKDVSGMSVTDISMLTKGNPDTSVNLTVKRAGEGEKTFEITRSTINMRYVKSCIDGDIGCIKISEFAKITDEQFESELSELMKQGINGLVIDLRDNPGGMIDVVTKIGDMLLPEGIITYTVDKNGGRTDFKSDADCIKIPIAVLVNGGSASASELLAGALQDSGVGTVIGTQTYGKGIVQGLYSLGDGSGLKITIQRYYTPNGVCIQGVGITPDHMIECSDKTLTESDEQYQKALEILSDKIKD